MKGLQGPLGYARSITLVSVTIVVAVAVWALHTRLVVIPGRYNPWAELDVAEAPNLLTRAKLDRAQREPARCLALLQRAGLHFQAVPDRATGDGCQLQNAVRLAGAGNTALSSPVLLSCRAALSFALWERHVVQRSALKNFGIPISRIQHLGGYACRNIVTGQSTPDGPPNRRSRHASADALDIAGFDPSGARSRITVRQHWSGAHEPAGKGPEAAFLRDVHQGGCRLFDGVLGPDFNAVHKDHFHLEVGGWRSCR